MADRRRVPITQLRRSLLARIHIASGPKHLAMDDATYRAMLKRITGHHSAADLTLDQLLAVYQEMVRLGFRATGTEEGKTAGKPKVGADRAKLMNKLGALLSSASLPWTYVDGQPWLKRITGVERLAFCDADALRKVVAALVYQQKRRTAKAASE